MRWGVGVLGRERETGVLEVDVVRMQAGLAGEARQDEIGIGAWRTWVWFGLGGLANEGLGIFFSGEKRGNLTFEFFLDNNVS